MNDMNIFDASSVIQENKLNKEKIKVNTQPIFFIFTNLFFILLTPNLLLTLIQ